MFVPQQVLVQGVPVLHLLAAYVARHARWWRLHMTDFVRLESLARLECPGTDLAHVTRRLLVHRLDVCVQGWLMVETGDFGYLY